MQDDTPLYQVGQRVVYMRQDIVGTKECPCCGSEVDQYADVETEHTVLRIDATYYRGGSVQHDYYLSGNIKTTADYLSVTKEDRNG